MFAARLTGEGTDLAGRAAPRVVGDGLRIAGLGGRLAWPLVAALAPGLPVACDLAAQVADVTLTLGPEGRGGQGGFATEPGDCRTPDGEVAAVPALDGRIETRGRDLAVVLAEAAALDTALAEAALTEDDRLVLTLFAEGAALIPGLPTGEVTLEYPLGGLPF